MALQDDDRKVVGEPAGLGVAFDRPDGFRGEVSGRERGIRADDTLERFI